MRIGQVTGPSVTPTDLGFPPAASLAVITSVSAEEEEQVALRTPGPAAAAAVEDPTIVREAAIPRG